jgi:hypothetical protein
MGLPVWPAWPAARAVWQVALRRGGALAARALRVSARNALLADIAPPPEAYGRAYGFELSMDNPGVIGGLAAWMVIALMLSSASARDQSR